MSGAAHGGGVINLRILMVIFFLPFLNIDNLLEELDRAPARLTLCLRFNGFRFICRGGRGCLRPKIRSIFKLESVRSVLGPAFFSKS